VFSYCRFPFPLRYKNIIPKNLLYIYIYIFGVWSFIRSPVGSIKSKCQDDQVANIFASKYGIAKSPTHDFSIFHTCLIGPGIFRESWIRASKIQKHPRKGRSFLLHVHRLYFVSRCEVGQFAALCNLQTVSRHRAFSAQTLRGSTLRI